MLTLLFKIAEGTVSRSTEFGTNGNAIIYGWKYRHYFIVVEETDTILRAKL